MITPILETDRILLRPLKVADAETIYKNWASDPDVAKYMRWNLHQSVKDTLEWLLMEEENITKENYYAWGFVLKDNNELFGSGGVFYNEGYQMFELGYNIMKKYWNLGYTTEASAAILNFATQKCGIVSVHGTYARDNPASGKVLEKLGFIYQKDGTYSSLDGNRTYESREYILLRQ